MEGKKDTFLIVAKEILVVEAVSVVALQIFDEAILVVMEEILVTY